MSPPLSSALSRLVSRRVRQGLCVCALAVGLTAGSAISPLRVVGPWTADATDTNPDANAAQAQPRGIPDLSLPGSPGQHQGQAKQETGTETGTGTGTEAGTGAKSEGTMGIPATALDAYKTAERALSTARPSCHVRWQLVAGIGRVESVHASGYGLRSDGSVAKPIRGPRLDGERFALIRDTDGGRWDGDAEFDRAIGPMQFLPSTWATWGADGNGDGVNDPHNLYDAALATGHYLCAGGRDLNRPADLDKAILNYNNSREYVNAVRDWMRTYQGGKVTATPDDAPATPHRPDPADTPSPAITSPRRIAPAQPRPEQDRLSGTSATSRPATPVPDWRPTTRPEHQPAEKPDPALNRHPGSDHCTVTRVERVGAEGLGDRTAGEAFGRRPQVRAFDAHGHPVSGAKVTYRIIGTGRAHFAGHATTATVTADDHGVATAPALRAGNRPGRVTVTTALPGERKPTTASFTATVRQAPAATADRLELLDPKLPQADINSRFPELPQTRATARDKPVPGIRLTATLLAGADDEEGAAEESTVGPYFKDRHGDPVRTLVLPTADADGRFALPQLFTDEHPGTYTLRLTTPEGATLDIPLTVGEPAPDGPGS
ncbi:lytic murein transglycosylase [Streptomyces chattanoogensis]|uniref:lytic murein transglycosylase n=1 Tax=Streptomyces chattanoogensis TaxID=66876 RepID=UPI000B1EDEA3|nr:lytic murein transglycosylase [Streptomyces chattanoogensis]